MLMMYPFNDIRITFYMSVRQAFRKLYECLPDILTGFFPLTSWT